MRPRIGIGWTKDDDLLRKRIDEVVSKSVRSAGFAEGEWLDPDVGPGDRRVHRRSHEVAWIDPTSPPLAEPQRRSFAYPQTELGDIVRAIPGAGPLDELLREIDRRDAANAGRGTSARCSSLAPGNDAGESLPSGVVRQEHERAAERPLDIISRQLDDLAREVKQREKGATNEEIAAFKHRLVDLVRETEREAERKLLGSNRGRPEPVWVAESDPFRRCERGERRLSSAPEPRWVTSTGPRDAGQFPGAPAMPFDGRLNGAPDSEPSIVLGPVAIPREFRPQGQTSEAADTNKAVSLTPDELVAIASDRWRVAPDRKHEDTAGTEDRPSPKAIDLELPPLPAARSVRPSGKKPSRSAIVPLVRAGMAAILAIAIVVPGAFLARSRIADMTSAGPAVIVHEAAPGADAAVSAPLTIMPANTVARFQNLVFQLPRLYGIYAINSGRLFELEALPGQAPDPRIAVSAAIPRPSHTTLPDGRVAFLLFRRDMATNVPERVQIRVVAKVKRSTTGPETERTARQEDVWTIRNIAIDFRVAPVEHNKEMVLLLSEKPDFAFPAGRYALILKGQAYDFTVAGPITDPAQCLERVEAANGSFFHECKSAPQAAVETFSQDDTPASAARSPSTSRRQGEMHARAEARSAKSR